MYNFEFQNTTIFRSYLDRLQVQVQVLNFYSEGLSFYQVTWLPELNISHFDLQTSLAMTQVDF